MTYWGVPLEEMSKDQLIKIIERQTHQIDRLESIRTTQEMVHVEAYRKEWEARKKPIHKLLDRVFGYQ